MYGLTELHREAIAGAGHRRQPRLLPDRDAARAGAARARRADRRRGRRRQVRRLRRRPRGDGQDALRLRRRERHAYGVPAHRHAPEIDQELAALGAALDDHLRPAPAAARPGRARLLLRHARRELGDRRVGRAVRGRLRRASPSSSSRPRPPGVRDVRDTNICRIQSRRPAQRPGDRVRRDRQPLEGRGSQAVQNLNLMFGRPEGGGRCDELSSPRAGSSGPAHVRELEGGLPAGLPRRRRRGRHQARRRARPRPARLRRRRRRRAPRGSRARACSRRRCSSCQERCDLDALRAVAVELRQRERRDGQPRASSAAARCRAPARWSPASPSSRSRSRSTGVIGVQLDGGPVVKGLRAARGELAQDGDARLRALRS